MPLLALFVICLYLFCCVAPPVPGGSAGGTPRSPIK